MKGENDMEKETLEKLKAYPNLKKYALHFEKTRGESEMAGYLPFIVIWFRDLFKKAQIDDGEVPVLFEMDDDTAEDFWSWGHNSRYSNVFSWWILDGMDFAIDVALQIIKNNDCKGFDPDIRKKVMKEKKEQEKAFKKFMEEK